MSFSLCWWMLLPYLKIRLEIPKRHLCLLVSRLQLVCTSINVHTFRMQKIWFPCFFTASIKSPSTPFTLKSFSTWIAFMKDGPRVKIFFLSGFNWIPNHLSGWIGYLVLHPLGNGFHSFSNVSLWDLQRRILFHYESIIQWVTLLGVHCPVKPFPLGYFHQTFCCSFLCMGCWWVSLSLFFRVNYSSQVGFCFCTVSL